MVFSDVDVASRPKIFGKPRTPACVREWTPVPRGARGYRFLYDLRCEGRHLRWRLPGLSGAKSAVLEFLCSLNTCRARALLPHHKRVGAPESLQPQSPLEGSVRVPRLRPEKG